MSYLRRPFGVIFLILMLVMGLQIGLKKPLCIDSNIVYKINNIKADITETIYSCNQFKKVPFSIYLYENLNSLEARLYRLEAVLTQLSINDKYQIAIDNINKTQLSELNNGIQIGIDLLATDRLERALLQLTLKNKLNTSNIIFLETFEC